MRNTLLAAVAAIGFVALATNAANATSGALDALDPCIATRADYDQQRLAIVTAADKGVTAAATAAMPAEYPGAWKDAKRKALRPAFDAEVAPVFRAMHVPDIDAAYGIWFDNFLGTIGPEKVNAMIQANFRREIQEHALNQRTQTAAQLDEARRDLDSSCKMDVGNQVIRGVLNVGLAPFAMIGRNLGVAANESGVGAQVLAGATGISVDSINKNGGVLGGGLSGGEGSFFRHNLGIRF